MARITTSKDCGNSPKNIFIQKFSIALVVGDMDYLLASIADEIQWKWIDDQLVQGRAEFEKAYPLTRKDIDDLTIFHVVSHGKAGAVHGRMKLTNSKVFEFCDVYEFTNARGTCIRDITSFSVEIKQQER